ncbi:MAG TPA: hypothetical protein VJN18_35250 [Polyangiaceae bacterium]|nr:hypothetical protein [Polyangiaceae bacterium]
MRLAALALLLGLTACGGGAGSDPDRVLREYSLAVEGGRAKEAYALLSTESKKSISFEQFQRILNENPEEARELAQSLRRPQVGPPRVTATVTGPDGESSILLVYEQGQWRVDASAVDLYSQRTPEAAVRAFLRAYENKRYDVLLRFVPEDQLDKELTPAELKKAWEGDEKADMDRLTDALKVSLPIAKVELFGDRATLAFGAGGSVELVRERGVWKIEDLK